MIQVFFPGYFMSLVFVFSQGLMKSLEFVFTWVLFSYTFGCFFLSGIFLMYSQAMVISPVVIWCRHVSQKPIISCCICLRRVKPVSKDRQVT